MNLKEIFSFENLYDAHKKCRNSKQHKGEVIRFEINLASNLSEMSKKLCNKTYQLGEYRRFYIYEPKERLIEALPYKDRVIIRCFCDRVIIPKIEKRLIIDNVACRKEKGTLFGMNRLKKFLQTEYRKKQDNNVYYLKCDIKKYFPSINHEVLINLLKSTNFTKDEIWFASKLINEQPNKKEKGLALGNQSSQWFALFYLNGIDRLVREKLKVKGYVRYMDDIILIHRDKDFLKRCKSEIEKYCNSILDLELNQKTQIGKASIGIDFLGFRHILTPSGKVIRKMRASSKIRLKQHLKKLSKLEKNGRVDKEYVATRKNAYYAHIIYSNEKYLKDTLQNSL